MAASARIGHLTVCKGLERLQLGESALIGNLNWITAFPKGDSLGFFAREIEREPELVLGPHAAITHRHLIDCTDKILIGDFSTFAGFRSQILTHSIDIALSSQSSAPVTVGKYCFVGTGSILLKGSSLPDKSVLGAGSVLTKSQTEGGSLYAGNPARHIKYFDGSENYFSRIDGIVR